MGDRWWKIDESTYTAFTAAERTECEAVLLTALKAHSYQENQRAMVVFEYIFGVLSSCSEASYSFKQAEELLAIHYRIFTRFVTPSTSSSNTDSENADGEETGSCEDAVQMFKDQIKPLASRESGPLFSVAECGKCAKFFASAFVRNFDAYKYALTHLPRERVQTKLLCVQTPHQLPSLADPNTLDSDGTIA